MSDLAAAIGPVPRWHWDAACGDKADLWKSKEPADIEEQRRVCQACPVRAECATHAAALPKPDSPDRVMAGLTRAERWNGDLVDAERECSICHVVKTLDQFPRRSRRLNGRTPECTDCHNARDRAEYQARKAKAAAK